MGKIRRLREAKGLSLREVADVVGTSHSTISRWERADSVPDRHAEALAQVLGVDARAIKGRSESTPEPAYGYVTSEAGLREWHECIMAAGIDDPRLLLLFLVLEHYIDRELWVISSTLPELAAQAALPIDLVEELWPEILASPFVERVGTGEWMLRLFVPADDDQPG